MKYLVIITLAILFTGCFTPQKAVDILSRPKNEVKAAEFCENKFPIVPIYIKGDSIVTTDTLWGLDTVHVKDTTKQGIDTVVIEKIATKVVTKTIRITDTIEKENPRKLLILSSENAKLKLDNVELNVKLSAAIQRGDDFRSKYHKTISWLVLCIVLIGVGTYLKIRKVI